MERAGWSNLWRALGPGILVACAAVGGSHLVWSTRAGAEYGWSLVGLILIANLLKYPFFLYGQRYTAATGESLLEGYRRQGVAYVWAFLAINILTGSINIAGVAMLSGALLKGYGLAPTVPTLTVLLLMGSLLVVIVGHYRLLDSMAKFILVFLTAATVAAVVLAAGKAGPPEPGFVAASPYTWASFAFLISLLGWMPAPIDLSAWSSLWMFSREKQTGHKATVNESAVDFYIGYGAATVLAVLFVALGAFVMYGTGTRFAEGGIGFSQQLVSLYTESIGEWSRWLILSAAFVTMISTTLTCIDGYPRSLAACGTLLGWVQREGFRRLHVIWMCVSVLVAVLVVQYLAGSLLRLLSFAAVISFLTSPILAWINFRVMRGDNVPERLRPGLWLSSLSWLGLAFFILMAGGYAYATFLAG